MSKQIDILRERVTERLRALDLSPRSASLKASGDKSPDVVRYIFSRDAMPGGERLASLAAVLQTTPDYLLGRANAAGASPAPGNLAAAPDIPATRSASSGETASIIALDLSLSMGPGTPIEDFVESEPLEFDIGLLRNITRSPFHRLRIVRGIGSSMEPKFYTGDRILVDTTERSLGRIDGYYWITLFGAHGLKKLRPVGKNRVLVISENPADENQEVDAEDLTIEGRAIWVGRDL